MVDGPLPAIDGQASAEIPAANEVAVLIADARPGAARDLDRAPHAGAVDTSTEGRQDGTVHANGSAARRIGAARDEGGRGWHRAGQQGNNSGNQGGGDQVLDHSCLSHAGHLSPATSRN
jgi:hypothetical protein